MSNEEFKVLIDKGQGCPWCHHTFRVEDHPLKHGETGRRYCDRDCFELDRKYPARKE